ncbi:hypothetical protein HMPREF1139_0857 [Campylobacter sp. FOBRC14]|nr:hypothetical protein HMPREF1139_0857 [Campylobacter sp. FOBRC14]
MKVKTIIEPSKNHTKSKMATIFIFCIENYNFQINIYFFIFMQELVFKGLF